MDLLLDTQPRFSYIEAPARRADLPGKELSFILCPLTPPARQACGARSGQPRETDRGI